jgi:hypothetical protein
LRRAAQKALPAVAQAVLDEHGTEHSVCLPGLGKYESRPPIFSNDHVSEQDILGGHFQATSERFAGADGPILILQDTTTFSYQRE